MRGLKMLAEATQKKGKIQHMPDLSLEHGKFMAQDWDRRADDSPLYWIAMMENEKEFVASGEANLREHILNDITLKPDAVALEIGCGIGRLMRPMAALCRKVIGVDVSARMIELSKSFLDGLSNVETFVTSGSTLPSIADNSIDLVYSFICFQHIPERAVIESYVRESFRALRPGGVFKFQVDGNIWEGRPRDHAETWAGACYSPDEICEACAGNRFQIRSVYYAPIGKQYLWVIAEKPFTTLRS